MARLSKESIIKSKRVFQEVYGKGRSWSDRHLVLYVLKTEGEKTKAGFAAGKKLGCAVVRNRMKRIMRESLRSNIDEIKDGLSLLLVGRAGAVGISESEMEASFKKLGKRAGIFRREE